MSSSESFPAWASEAVTATIAAFVAETNAHERDYRALAARLHALPLYADRDGCILLRPGGELVAVGTDPAWDQPLLRYLDLEPPSVQLALKRGFLRFPALAPVFSLLKQAGG